MTLVAANIINDLANLSLYEPERKAFQFNEKFVQTVDFNKLTAKWIEARKLDYDFKVLRVQKCPSMALLKLRIREVRKTLNSLSSLFVLVFDILGEFNDFETKRNTSKFKKMFKDKRPVILQFNADGRTSLYCREFKDSSFVDLSEQIFEENQAAALQMKLIEQKNFRGNLLTASMMPIDEESDRYLARSTLCMRVFNLFGGCERIMPWVKKHVLLKEDLNVFLAFIDYPFNPDVAVELAWTSRRFDYLEIFINNDCRFPKDFSLNEIDPDYKENFEKIINQREILHRFIEDDVHHKVSKISKEIRKGANLKRAFNVNNESVFVTAFRNFKIDMYELLVTEKFEHCEKSVFWLQVLPYHLKNELEIRNLEPFSADVFDFIEVWSNSTILMMRPFSLNT